MVYAYSHLSFLQFLSSVSYNFWSIGLLHPWLNLFLYFYAIANSIGFLVSLSDSLLLADKKTTSFWTLILYPDALVFSIHSIMLSANSDGFTSSFPIWMPLFLLILLLLWVGLLALCWKKVVKVDITVLFLILRKILLLFAHCVWCWLRVCHLWPLLCWGMFLLFPLCWEFSLSSLKFSLIFLSILITTFFVFYIW